MSIKIRNEPVDSDVEMNVVASVRVRLRWLLAGAACLAILWYFIPRDHARSVDGGFLFPRDQGPPLSSKTEMEIAALEESVRQNPPNAETQTRLAEAYLLKGRATNDPIYLNKAEALFKKALELDTRDFRAMAGMGSISLSRHAFRDAIGWGERAVALNPWSSDLYAILGDANVELGDYKEAITFFQKMVDLRPQLSSYSRISYMRELHGDISGAIEAMKMAVSAGGGQPENVAWARVHLGNLYISAGEYSTAEREFETALADVPNYAQAYGGLANLRIAQGRERDAIELYKRVVDALRLPSYRIVLADLYQASGQRQLANREYALIREIAVFNRDNDKDTEPEIILFAADHANPDELDEIVSWAKRQFERQPNVKMSDTLAWCYYKAQQFEPARAAIQRALALGTKDPLMRYHAGMIHLALGDKQTAKALLSEALSLNSHFSVHHAPKAAKALEGL